MSIPSRRVLAVDFLQMIVRGRVDEAFRNFAGEDFRHHNPFFAEDAASIASAMKEHGAANPDMALEVRMTLEDADLVCVLAHVRQNADDRGYAVAHFFRFDGLRIVEMWDIGQEIPLDSPNRLGMF